MSDQDDLELLMENYWAARRPLDLQFQSETKGMTNAADIKRLAKKFMKIEKPLNDKYKADLLAIKSRKNQNA